MDSSIVNLVDKLADVLPEVRDHAMGSLCTKITSPLSNEYIAGLSRDPRCARLILQWINDRYDAVASHYLVSSLELCLKCVLNSDIIRDSFIESGGVSFFKDFSAALKLYEPVCRQILRSIDTDSLWQFVYDLRYSITIPLEWICYQIADLSVKDCTPLGVLLVEKMSRINSWSHVLLTCFDSLSVRPEFVPFALKLISHQNAAFPPELYVSDHHRFEDGTEATVRYIILAGRDPIFPDTNVDDMKRGYELYNNSKSSDLNLFHLGQKVPQIQFPKKMIRLIDFDSFGVTKVPLANFDSIVGIACREESVSIRLSAIRQACMMLYHNEYVSSRAMITMVANALKIVLENRAPLCWELAQLLWFLLPNTHEFDFSFLIPFLDDTVSSAAYLVLSKCGPSATAVAVCITLMDVEHRSGLPHLSAKLRTGALSAALVCEMWRHVVDGHIDAQFVWKVLLTQSSSPWAPELIAMYTYLGAPIDAGQIEFLGNRAKSDEFIAASLRLIILRRRDCCEVWSNLLVDIVSTTAHSYTLLAALYLISYGGSDIDPERLLVLAKEHELVDVRIICWRILHTGEIAWNAVWDHEVVGEEYYEWAQVVARALSAERVRLVADFILMRSGTSVWEERGNMVLLTAAARQLPGEVIKALIHRDLFPSVLHNVELVHLCLIHDPELQGYLTELGLVAILSTLPVDGNLIDLLAFLVANGIYFSSIFLHNFFNAESPDIWTLLSVMGPQVENPHNSWYTDLTDIRKCKILSKFFFKQNLLKNLMETNKSIAVSSSPLFLAQIQLCATCPDSDMFAGWFSSVWVRTTSVSVHTELLRAFSKVLDRKPDLSLACWSSPLSLVLGLLTQTDQPDIKTFTLGLRVAALAAPALVGKPVTGRIVAVLLSHTSRRLLVLRFCSALLGCPFTGEHLVQIVIDNENLPPDLCIQLIASLVLAGGHCRLAMAKTGSVIKWLSLQEGHPIVSLLLKILTFN